MKKSLLISYLFLVHLLLAVVVVPKIANRLWTPKVRLPIDIKSPVEFPADLPSFNHEIKSPLVAFMNEPRTIVCLGDSVTGVYFHTGGELAYPELLGISLRSIFPQTPITVINAGISGNTTADGLARLDGDVLDYQPDLVTISFGLNDVVRLELDEFRTNLESLVSRCLEANCQVMLCTPNAVIDTPERPTAKLESYCAIIRDVGRRLSVPVCDQYRFSTELRRRSPQAWRLAMSDEIHPNLDGHKRMAEELCRCILCPTNSLYGITPQRDFLERTRSILRSGGKVRAIVMSPYDAMIRDVLGNRVEVTTWSVKGKTITILEQEAAATIRSMKPDLVVLAIPLEATAKTEEQFVRSFTQVMNWSLSFGLAEWDCVVVHPSVSNPNDQSALYRRLVWAQGLTLIDRETGDDSSAQELISRWFIKRIHATN